MDKIANLARLGPYAPEREAALKKEMEKILELFRVFEKLETRDGNVEKKFNAPGTPLREDAARKHPARDSIIAGFPEKESSLLKVPKVIEQ